MADKDWFARQASRAANEMRSLPDWLRGDSTRHENRTRATESGGNRGSEGQTHTSNERSEPARREPNE